MTDSFAIACLLLAMFLSIPLLVLALECLLGLVPLRQSFEGSSAEAIVVIPAHNEALGIEITINELRKTLGPAHRILVVADNCTDDTADIAERAGAEVVERTCPSERGKGFALAFGISHIRSTQAFPDVVVILDADCQIEGLECLIQECYQKHKVIQCTYLMGWLPGSGVGQRVSAFAFRVKNLIRLRGLSRLGGASLLTGTGMAFPWKIVQEVDWGGGEIVEDLATGLQLVVKGADCSPEFTEVAQVRSLFPRDAISSHKQRRRWEHGHLKQSLFVSPILVLQGISQGRWKVFITGMDVMIPPLSLLSFMVAFGVIALSVSAAMTGVVFPIIVLVANAAFLALAMILVWWVEGRDILPAHCLPNVIGYVLRKLTIYASFVVNREASWVRTSRV